MANHWKILSRGVAWFNELKKKTKETMENSYGDRSRKSSKKEVIAWHGGMNL
jgi:hypothetical protein